MYDIFFDLNNMHQLVDDPSVQMKIDDDEFQLNLDFLSDYIDDFAVPVDFPRSANGFTCISCKELYPYADRPNQKDGTFKCWGCRHL